MKTHVNLTVLSLSVGLFSCYGLIGIMMLCYMNGYGQTADFINNGLRSYCSVAMVPFLFSIILWVYNMKAKGYPNFFTAVDIVEAQSEKSASKT